MPFGGGFRRGGFRRDFGPTEKHKIKCSECGKEDEVPFKPREGTPVYCRSCFMKRRGITPREGFREKPREQPKEKEEAEKSEEETEDKAEEAEEEPVEE